MPFICSVRAAVAFTQRLFYALQSWRSVYVAKNAASIVTRLLQALHQHRQSSAISASILEILTSVMASPKVLGLLCAVSVAYLLAQAHQLYQYFAIAAVCVWYIRERREQP